MEVDKAFIEKVLFGKINLQESKYKIPENKESMLLEVKFEINRTGKNDFQLTFMTKNNEVFNRQTVSLNKGDALTLDGIGFTLTIES